MSHGSTIRQWHVRGTGLRAASGSKGLRVPGAEAACGGKGGGSWEVKPEAREAGTGEAVCAGYGGEPHPESL